MPTTDTNPKQRANLRLSVDLLKRIDSWARSASVSRSKAIEELARIGLDADTSGLESSLGMQQQLRKDIASLRALTAESVTASDTTAALQILAMAKSNMIDTDKMIGSFVSARRMAREQLKKAKKTA